MDELFPSLNTADRPFAVRLLEILPGNDELQCSFHVSSVLDPKPFIALSYTWGTSSSQCSIQLNGQPFSVGRNLHEALLAIRDRCQRTQDRQTKKHSLARRMGLLNTFSAGTKSPACKYDHVAYSYHEEECRHDLSTTLVWVDQLCIKQWDIEERNAQVQLMARIYSSAKVVLIWLGTHPQAEVVHETIAILEATNLETPKQRRSKKKRVSPSYEQRAVMEKYIATNAYWTRLWIVQEITLAQKALVQVGSVVFDYEELLPMFLKGPGGSSQNPTYTYRGFDHWRIEDTPMGQLLWFRATLQDLEKAESELTIHMLLTFMEKQQCSDARDKIFGLLGLVHAKSSAARKTLAADYNLTSEQVYAMVVSDAMQRPFPNTTSALDLCRKAAIALDCDTEDGFFVDSTADFLLKIVGKDYAPWNPRSWEREKKEITLGEVKERIRACRWKSSLNNIIASLLPGTVH